MLDVNTLLDRGRRSFASDAMTPWSFSAQRIAVVVMIFVVAMVGFGVLSATVGWPDSNGWGLAILAAFILALLPLLGPLLSFLHRSGAVLDLRGFKIDFSRAPRVSGSEPRELNLQQNPGQDVTDSNAASIAEAAAVARDAQIVVVDLGTGRSWYTSRLFALAVAAHELGGAAGIILLAQRGGIPRCFLGWISPQDLIQAMFQHDARYRDALNRAKATLEHLRRKRSSAIEPPPDFKADIAKLSYSYDSQGDLALVPALINVMQANAIEDRNAPVWLSADDAERLFDAWLVRDRISSRASDREVIETVARARHRFLAVEEDHQYLGMADVDAFLRQFVLRLAEADAPQAT